MWVYADVTVGAWLKWSLQVLPVVQYKYKYSTVGLLYSTLTVQVVYEYSTSSLLYKYRYMYEYIIESYCIYCICS
jgi:hypothetical protein